MISRPERLGSPGQGDLPDANNVVGVSGKQSLAVSGPCHRETLGWSCCSVAGHLRAELFDHVLAFQVPDLDRWACGSTEPVPNKKRGCVEAEVATNMAQLDKCWHIRMQLKPQLAS